MSSFGSMLTLMSLIIFIVIVVLVLLGNDTTRKFHIKLFRGIDISSAWVKDLLKK